MYNISSIIESRCHQPSFIIRYITKCYNYSSITIYKMKRRSQREPLMKYVNNIYSKITKTECRNTTNGVPLRSTSVLCGFMFLYL
jgi:hypothetical protein